LHGESMVKEYRIYPCIRDPSISGINGGVTNRKKLLRELKA